MIPKLKPRSPELEPKNLELKPKDPGAQAHPGSNAQDIGAKAQVLETEGQDPGAKAQEPGAKGQEPRKCAYSFGFTTLCKAPSYMMYDYRIHDTWYICRYNMNKCYISYHKSYTTE